MGPKLKFDVLPYTAFVVDCPGAQSSLVQQAMKNSGLLGGSRIRDDMIVSVPGSRNHVMIVPADGVTLDEIKDKLLKEISKCITAGGIRVGAEGQVLSP